MVFDPFRSPPTPEQRKGKRTKKGKFFIRWWILWRGLVNDEREGGRRVWERTLRPEEFITYSDGEVVDGADPDSITTITVSELH